jgi:hypothetical protein
MPAELLTGTCPSACPSTEKALLRYCRALPMPHGGAPCFTAGRPAERQEDLRFDGIGGSVIQVRSRKNAPSAQI